MEDLSWREKLLMLLILGSWFVALTLIFADKIHQHFVVTNYACGVECREELAEMKRLYIYNRDDGHSCAAEFKMCLEMVDDSREVE